MGSTHQSGRARKNASVSAQQRSKASNGDSSICMLYMRVRHAAYKRSAPFVRRATWTGRQKNVENISSR